MPKMDKAQITQNENIVQVDTGKHYKWMIVRPTIMSYNLTILAST